MNRNIFVTVHNLLNDTNLIDSFQADLHVQYTSRNDTGAVIDIEPHLSRTCKTSLLFAPLAVRDHTGFSAFPFYTPSKMFIRLYIKYKTVLFPKL